MLDTISVPYDAIYFILLLSFFIAIISLFNFLIERETENVKLDLVEETNLIITNLSNEPSSNINKSVDYKSGLTQLKEVKKLVIQNTRSLCLGAIGFFALSGSSLILLDKNQNLPAVLESSNVPNLKTIKDLKGKLSLNQLIENHTNKNIPKKILYKDAKFATSVSTKSIYNFKNKFNTFIF